MDSRRIQPPRPHNDCRRRMVYFRNVQGQRHPPYHLRNSVRSTRSRSGFLHLPHHPRRDIRHSAAAIPAVQPLLCCSAHTGVARALRLACPQEERAVGSPQDRLRHDHGRRGLWSDAHRIDVHRRHSGVSITQLANFHLSAPHVCRTSALTDGHIVCQQSRSPEAQRLDDGRMVCRHSRRQLSCVDPYAPLG